MKNMKITLICAMGENREIGQGNALLWDLPIDMKHFRLSTAGKPVVMGRKTCESIGMLLPKRRNIILSRNADFTREGAEIFSDITSLLESLQEDEPEIFVIGGSNIYDQFLPFATHLSLTFVHKKFPNADAFFPEFSGLSFRKISEKNYSQDIHHDYSFDICEYEKSQ